MQKKAFSLIEMIIWISISVLLMVSVWIFVNSWMKTIFYGQKSIENMSELNYFVKDIYSSFEKMSTWSVILNTSWSWLLFKRNKLYNQGWFSYIWITEQDNYFCDDPNSESTKTKHVFIKNFIPFWTNWNELNITSNWYTSYQKENKIIDNNSKKTIVWKDIFWHDFEEWAEATNVYLNSPTWIATDGEKLYISDTLNNRILFLSWTTIHKLLDETDWLKEPTWLYYDSWDKALYISNSWNWEILSFSNKTITPFDINLSFSGINENNINNIEIEFYNNWIDYNILDVDLNNSFHDKTYNSQNIVWNKLEYSLQKETFNASWEVIWYEDDYFNFNNWDTYNIDLKNLLSFNEPWNYYIKLTIWNYEKYFPYLSQWDEKIYTKKDNILKVLHSWKNYPNEISGPWEFQFETFNIASEIENITFNPETDIILSTPIDSLKIEKTSNDMLFLNLKYYTNYNCYNLDENTWRVRTFIANKNLK